MKNGSRTPSTRYPASKAALLAEKANKPKPGEEIAQD
jgi:hypothetical protein